eukprot:CAMPEP_0175873190 /NCGR_PEP_ID=MMETSP0107_2-20121207/38165_1 /TAXON_ID=195067 ORGANISM="Goniomonas pacifica, Strain CCMP1869" /NCGR_SAMPLE_ID=MMETSP0107_2 /ASSEMBLY_ACC=CAM_ASM_000203 /LENGTH=122 /DNA_ID=CAMNT_0017191877 /DNA_START=51 /DNA_END=415 /DNA_ORIENTATION=+
MCTLMFCRFDLDRREVAPPLSGMGLHSRYGAPAVLKGTCAGYGDPGGAPPLSLEVQGQRERLPRVRDKVESGWGGALEHARDVSGRHVEEEECSVLPHSLYTLHVIDWQSEQLALNHLSLCP